MLLNLVDGKVDMMCRLRQTTTGRGYTWPSGPMTKVPRTRRMSMQTMSTCHVAYTLHEHVLASQDAERRITIVDRN